MRSLRFIFIALITFLFVTNAVFLVRTVSYGKADAAAPPSSAVVTSKDFSVVQKDEQKIADCIFGVCIKRPQIPTSIPGVPSGGQKEPIPPANPQSNVSLVGKWQSDWGPVEFNSDLTGHWNQGGGIGQIKDGTYDAQTRKLVFHYYQPWNDMNGTATLTLSGDGNRLSGTWTQQRGSNSPGSGGSGGWTMTRDTTVSAPISFYKLSAYKIEVGSNEVGVVTTPVDTVLAQFATKPDSKTIYTDGTSNSLDYVLDGIATPQDIQGLKKKVLSVSETAQSVLDNTLQIFKDSIPTVSGQNINAEFHPKGKTIGSVSLGSLAKALGYESFNWLQVVSKEPSNAVVYDGFDQLIVDRGKILLPTRIFYRPQPEDNTFYDPLPGGNDIRVVSYVEEGSSILRSTLIGLDLLIAKGIARLHLTKMYAADTQPFYYDIPGFADGNLKGRLRVEEFPSVLEKISKNGQSLTFFDRPELYNIPDEDFTLFKTSLVGLKSATGNQYELIPNYTFTWKSNYDSCHRGAVFPPLPGCSKGGSTTLISK